MQRVSGLRHDLRFEPVGGAHKLSRRTTLFQRIGYGDGRIDVASGTPARKNNGHCRLPTRRARPTLAMSATAIRLTTSELPPNEMNGSGTPVTGHDDVTTPILIKAWIATIAAQPTARKNPKRSG